MIPREAFDAAVGDGVSTKVTYFGEGKHIVTFPVRSGKLVNFVGYRWDGEGERARGRKGPWSEVWPVEEALKDFEGFSERCLGIIKAIPEASCWGVFAVPPIETCIDDGVDIIGDAAHGTTPHNGAGAGMSVEDAFFISSILSSPVVTTASLASRPAQIRRALEIYRDTRHARGLENVQSSMRTGRMLDLSGLNGEGKDPVKITRALQASLDEVWKYDTAGELRKALEKLEGR